MIELLFRCYECDHTLEVNITPDELLPMSNWSTSPVCVGCRKVHEVWFDGQTVSIEPTKYRR